MIQADTMTLVDEWNMLLDQKLMQKDYKLKTINFLQFVETISKKDDSKRELRSFFTGMFTGSNIDNYQKMWEPKYNKRTEKAMKTLAIKSLENTYIKDCPGYEELEKALAYLRLSMKTRDFKKFSHAKGLALKLNEVITQFNKMNWTGLTEIVNSWYLEDK